MMMLIFYFILTICNQFIISTSAKNLSYTFDTLKPGPLGSQVCMEELGCFNMTKDFFHSTHRPLNFLPEDRAVIDTEFRLYTKEYPMEYQEIKHNDPESLEALDISIKTIFIVHGFGFIDNAEFDKWMKSMKNHLLLIDDYNVILVNWSKGNLFPYTRATANTRVVGAEIALLIMSLMKNRGLDPMKVHIVGHSLGAHIAGYAGERIHELGRITGLDPAAPYFEHMPPPVRLDPTDADFVDVIHTDSFSQALLALGMGQTCGHVDFFPNNGQNQPGCTDEAVQSIFLDGLVDASTHFVTCSHSRVQQYFMYSASYKRAPPIGYECYNWRQFVNGRCADYNERTSAIMGLHADKFRPYKNDSQSAKMYLVTGTTVPYMVYSYQLSIKLDRPNIFVLDRHGKINILINGTKNNCEFSFGATDLVHGVTYTHLVHDTKMLGQIKGMSCSWTSSLYTLFETPKLHLENIAIKPMNIADAAEQKMQTKKFCNEDLKPLETGVVKNLVPC